MNNLSYESARMSVLVRADIAAHIRIGRMTRDIMRLLAVPRAAVEDVRSQLGLPSRATRGFRPRSIEDVFWGHVRHLPDGHALWLGDHDPHGGPCLEYRPYMYSARRVAFRLRHGRTPDGPVTVTCGYDQCVESAHLADEPTRAYLTAVVAALFGDPA